MKVPILQITGLAFRDAYRALRAMPAISVIVLLICLAEAVLTEMIQQRWPLPKTVSFVGTVVIGFMLTPFLIAIHRYILLGEVTTRYRVDVQSRRFQKFFGYSVLLMLLIEGATAGDMIFGDDTHFGVLLPIPAMIVFVIVSVKLVLIFPAIAIESDTAQWSDAMRGTRGSFWRIFSVCFLVLLPELLLVIVPMMLEPSIGEEAGHAAHKRTAAALLGVANFISQAVLVAAASHLFRVLGDKMRDRPSAAHP